MSATWRQSFAQFSRQFRGILLICVGLDWLWCGRTDSGVTIPWHQQGMDSMKSSLRALAAVSMLSLSYGQTRSGRREFVLPAAAVHRSENQAHQSIP